ncbi:tyrosine-protein kinase family protein [bacterium]|nr:MAG: tyrosine-protein kinase family protein [bacterium]
MLQTLHENYRMLRVSVEAAVAPPGLIVVSSALAGDGKTEVASGLARALAECGYTTALIDTNWQHPGVAASLGIDEIAPVTQLERIASGGHNGVVTNLEAISIADRRFPALVSADRMRALIADLRARYQYTIIDSAAIPVGMAGLQFARFADGVLLTVRLGRAPKPADKMTIETLDRVGAHVLGIVATSAHDAHRKDLPQAASGVADESGEPVRLMVGAGA